MDGKQIKAWLLGRLSGGGVPGDLTATAGDVLVGKTAVGMGGEVIVGTLPNYFQNLNLGLSVPDMPTVEESAT
jgi:hypothetical protein